MFIPIILIVPVAHAHAHVSAPAPVHLYNNNITGTLTHDGVHRVLKLEASKMNKVADFFVREMASAVPVVPSVIFSSSDKVCDNNK